MHSLLIALQFLTRIPVGLDFKAGDKQLGYSVLYYPLIGLLIGGLLTILATLLANSPAMVAAAILLTAWVLLTGALHLDGLADCADAWVGGFGDRQRSLRIMKDPASGPIAVTLLMLVLLLKWTALAALIEQNRLVPLLMTPLLGRSAILLLMLSTPYVSPQGLAEKLLKHLPETAARWVAGLSIAVAAFVLGLLPILFAGLLLLWIRHTAISRLGGVTGDVYGAAVELVETAVLLGAVLYE
ncbi:MAG: adenosylcobinamide-GDP ribazoletransferase [Methylococcaceae bacterium]|nr:adenosylcobinamide-GDP ribazoletransferase [Methylococcaceae bacterium]